MPRNLRISIIVTAIGFCCLNGQDCKGGVRGNSYEVQGVLQGQPFEDCFAFSHNGTFQLIGGQGTFLELDLILISFFLADAQAQQGIVIRISGVSFAGLSVVGMGNATVQGIPLARFPFVGLQGGCTTEHSPRRSLSDRLLPRTAE